MWRKESHLTSNVHFFSSHFYSTLQKKGPSGVSRWTSKKNINIFTKTFIFIPINESLHWSLCVVCNPGRIETAVKYYESNDREKNKMKDEVMPCIIFMDSLKAHRKLRVASNVYKWLNFKWQNPSDGNLDINFDRRTMPIFDPQVPYQNNSWDCGVFVCRYALGLYQQRHRTITFEDRTDRLHDFITESNFFNFDMDNIGRFRNE